MHYNISTVNRKHVSLYDSFTVDIYSDICTNLYWYIMMSVQYKPILVHYDVSTVHTYTVTL